MIIDTLLASELQFPWCFQQLTRHAGDDILAIIMFLKRDICALLFCLCLVLPPFPAGASPAAGRTYYVSSSGGADDNDGLSPATSLASVSRVNALDLQPGDQVLFKCADVWRADPLILSKSGTQAAPITFSSYPADCSDQPLLSGSRPIGGWVPDAGNLYYADLPPDEFPLGINQLFRNGERLTLGRWPNLDAPDGGYAFVDAHTAGSDRITDAQLPGVDWSGAIVHIKNIRWSMLDRQVLSSSGHTLTLNQGLSCLVSGWTDCTGWGYFINNHLNTLDEDGEWVYDEASRRVYLYSTGGLPANIEGSVILESGGTLRLGGVMLSDGSATAYLTLDNLAIKNWFNHGIGTPAGMNGDIYHDITVRNVTIQDVDGAGVNLSSWLERPSNGRKGLRGGYNLVFAHNLIEGANSFGITGYFAASTFEDNTIRDIALVSNLGRSGMGCGLTSNECTENGDGFRIRRYDERDSGYGNTLRYNRFERIGYNAVDVFGPHTLLEANFITQACYTKADCGAVRTFGNDSLVSTGVYNIRLVDNVIVDIPGNVDGCEASRAPFGMGLYIDNYSRDVELTGNTVISTTVSGILYQRSSGQVRDNTVFNASSGTAYSAQISLSGSGTQVSLSGNRLYALNPNAWTLYVADLSDILSSNNNDLFHPYVEQHIAYGLSWSRMSFSQWQAFSGQDRASRTNWFSQAAGEPSRGRIFYNASKSPLDVDLGSRDYLDLDQVPVNSLTLAPFSSQILIDNGPAALALTALQPVMMAVSQVSDFTLTVSGRSFTPDSVIRWNAHDLPTTFIGSTRLSATVPAAEVSLVGEYPVSVWDPNPAPAGTETPPLLFRVVAEIYHSYFPLTRR